MLDRLMHHGHGVRVRRFLSVRSGEELGLGLGLGMGNLLIGELAPFAVIGGVRNPDIFFVTERQYG